MYVSFRMCVLVVLALPFIPATAKSGGLELLGQASVIDGDTLDIHGTRIRIWGIDAPESDQLCRKDGTQYRCGAQAANALLVPRHSDYDSLAVTG